MKKLCYVATIPAVVHSFLRGHIQTASEKYQITVVCNFGDKELLDGLNARLIHMPIQRRPSPLNDLLILLKLFALFRRERFDIVHSIMPKTGMLAMLAAWLAIVPVRIHTFTGQVWVTKKGIKRTLLKWFDKLIGIFGTCVLTDSPAQRDFLVSEGVLRTGKAKLIGAGSICGVDPDRFYPDENIRREVRIDLGIAQDAKVILFVGRLNRDKGIPDLVAAFDSIARLHSDVVLLLVGVEEDVFFSEIQEACHAEIDRLHYIQFTSAPQRYMVAADIFCLPSYREGFSMTLIEAAACGIPAVASRIYGITDAVIDQKTALLFPPGDVCALIENLLKLITENESRHRMGDAARSYVLELFLGKRITAELIDLYDILIEDKSP